VHGNSQCAGRGELHLAFQLGDLLLNGSEPLLECLVGVLEEIDGFGLGLPELRQLILQCSQLLLRLPVSLLLLGQLSFCRFSCLTDLTQTP
jgi:hypothetical protein